MLSPARIVCGKNLHKKTVSLMSEAHRYHSGTFQSVYLGAVQVSAEIGLCVVAVDSGSHGTVSYTHLTLPTKLEV